MKNIIGDVVYLKNNLNDQKVQYLNNSDKTLGGLIKYIGNSELVIEKDGFKCLIKYIIGQQISDKARETIWQRVCYMASNLTPNIIILLINYNILHTAGLSSRKIKYIRILAESIVKKRIDFEEFQTLSNENIITKLTVLEDIGRWTAEMYLIFSLGRENLLLKEDRTIRHTIQSKRTTFSRIAIKIFINWIEYTTIVSLYFWKAIQLGLTKKSFDKTILTNSEVNV